MVDNSLGSSRNSVKMCTARLFVHQLFCKTNSVIFTGWRGGGLITLLLVCFIKCFFIISFSYPAEENWLVIHLVKVHRWARSNKWVEIWKRICRRMWFTHWFHKEGIHGVIKVVYGNCCFTGRYWAWTEVTYTNCVIPYNWVGKTLNCICIQIRMGHPRQGSIFYIAIVFIGMWHLNQCPQPYMKCHIT
jgi:hypothetical protein